mmetsp:Transcript_26693/g.60273  ORF Transcript_26693/g.60273 Transcript_26693/m.60273 type:complete len:207 (+) Transcript_26693:856-1476(+)
MGVPAYAQDLADLRGVFAKWQWRYSNVRLVVRRIPYSCTHLNQIVHPLRHRSGSSQYSVVPRMAENGLPRLPIECHSGGCGLQRTDATERGGDPYAATNVRANPKGRPSSAHQGPFATGTSTRRPKRVPWVQGISVCGASTSPCFSQLRHGRFAENHSPCFAQCVHQGACSAAWMFLLLFTQRADTHGHRISFQCQMILDRAWHAM